ncbi:MAG: flippase-like domain-containing protein [Nanohaloarchaea archaeon]|nr:flippase-like domain-containing protein [Candidatus Nanohaloarchaea archaeon]
MDACGEEMKKKIIATIVGMLTFLAVFIYLGPDKILSAIVNANPFFLLLVIANILLLNVIQTIRFEYVYSKIEKHSRRFLLFLKIQMITNVLNYATPFKSGELMKSYLMKKTLRTSHSVGLGVVFLEKVFDFFIIIFLIYLSVLLGGTNGYDIGKYMFGITILFLIISIVTLFVVKKQTKKIIVLIPYIKRFVDTKKIEIFETVIKDNINIKNMASISIQTIFLQMGSALRLYLLFLAFGQSVSLISVSLIFFVSLLIGIISLLPGGIGSFEVSGLILYTQILSIDPIIVGSSLLLMRGMTYLIDIPIGLYFNMNLKEEYKTI